MEYNYFKILWWILSYINMNRPQVYMISESEVAQSCPSLCDPVDCSLRGSSIHGIFQARALEWVAISFSRGSSWSRDGTWVSHTASKRFYHLSQYDILQQNYELITQRKANATKFSYKCQNQKLLSKRLSKSLVR